MPCQPRGFSDFLQGSETHCPCAQLGDHRAALRILALTLGDIRLAEGYCARFTGREGHLLLLDLLLHPGDGRPPLYIEACHLLAAQG